MTRLLLLLILSIPLMLTSASSDPDGAIFKSLDPTSIAEHLAYYDLNRETKEGKEALKTALRLIGVTNADQYSDKTPFPDSLDPFLKLIQITKNAKTPPFSEAALQLIETASKKLTNRSLKGFGIANEQELLSLPENEIDLAEALFLLEIQDPLERRRMRALIDLMALQILVRIPKEATATDKIDAINHLVFIEMGFRFPPQSTFKENIDRFTMLGSVIEERRGVCLGTCLLYIALAQRLDLPMEIITPPGHIYVRSGKRNIETTMRGVHLPDTQYLNINTKFLYSRSLKEAIGLSFINQASIYLSQHNFEKALELYKRASSYIKNDALLQELIGTTCYLTGNKREAKKAFLASKTLVDDAYSPNILVDDILEGNIPKEAVEPLFMLVTEKRESIIKKKEALEKTLSQYPQFRAGLFHLALCYLSLGQTKDAIVILERRSALPILDVSTEFCLTELYLKRDDLPKARSHFQKIKQFFEGKEKFPEDALSELEYLLYIA